MKKFIELFGWYGTFAILLSYTLASFSVLKADGIWYQALVISGCAGIAIVSLYKKTYQPAVLNAISMLIGLAAVARILLR